MVSRDGGFDGPGCPERPDVVGTGRAVCGWTLAHLCFLEHNDTARRFPDRGMVRVGVATTGEP